MTDPAPLRKAGVFFAAVFAVLAYLAREIEILPYVLIAAAVATVATAIARPALLEVPTRRWMQLGAAMHKVVNPVVLGVIYLVLFVPTGWLRRLLAGDPMKRLADPSLESYWIDSETREHSLEEFRRPY